MINETDEQSTKREKLSKKNKKIELLSEKVIECLTGNDLTFGDVRNVIFLADQKIKNRYKLKL